MVRPRSYLVTSPLFVAMIFVSVKVQLKFYLTLLFDKKKCLYFKLSDHEKSDFRLFSREWEISHYLLTENK